MFITVAPALAQNTASARARRVSDDIRVLAADSLEGRKTCQPGNEKAASWLARSLRQAGVRPAGDSGGYFQHWTTGNSTGTREAGIAGCRTLNVIGVVPGRGSLAGQMVIVGAHFDHLGRGPFGSRAPGDSGQVHNGADDNASGVAAGLEIARLETRHPAPGTRRTVVFAFWSGEEEGSLGSAWFAEHLPVPKDSIIAYLNFDMVGRLHENRVMALGARTASEWPALLDSVNAEPRLDVRASGDGWGPSDHASFFAKKIPVLHFFTDLHEDYHTPRDDAERINADGIVRIADLGDALLRRLEQRRPMLTFVDAPPPAPVAGQNRARPSLGTIPDMTDEPGGVRLSGVRTGSAADSAGMREGDILVGIAADTVANLQDFQNALMKHVAGDTVQVRWLRNGQLMRFMVQLGGRTN